MDLLVRLVGDEPDQRGSSWTVPCDVLPPDFVVRDAHVMTVLPGAIRGDHLHLTKQEVFLVTYLDKWTLYWEDGSEQFDGRGCVAILVPPMLAHAIRNGGRAPLHVVALSDAPYDPAQPDAIDRKVSVP